MVELVWERAEGFSVTGDLGTTIGGGAPIFGFLAEVDGVGACSSPLRAKNMLPIVKTSWRVGVADLLPPALAGGTAWNGDSSNGDSRGASADVMSMDSSESELSSSSSVEVSTGE